MTGPRGPRATTAVGLAEHARGPVASRRDVVPTEEPLEIRVEHVGANHPIAVTMRTPGDDVALALGFLFTEGVIDGPGDWIDARLCAGPGPDGTVVENVVQVHLRPDHPFDMARFARHVYATSSCGICGKASIDAIEVACQTLPPARPLVEDHVLRGLPARLRATQEVFASTGGLHATALFAPDGALVDLAEDVGRHNATDKVIGRALMGGRLPLHDLVLVVSGRVSFEIVQKAARAGVPVVAALGAPSSLALEAADRLGLTVIGFLSAERFNVYTHLGRVA